MVVLQGRQEIFQCPPKCHRRVRPSKTKMRCAESKVVSHVVAREQILRSAERVRSSLLTQGFIHNPWACFGQPLSANCLELPGRLFRNRTQLTLRRTGLPGSQLSRLMVEVNSWRADVFVKPRKWKRTNQQAWEIRTWWSQRYYLITMFCQSMLIPLLK